MKDRLGDNPIIKVNGISLERLRYAMQLAQGFPAYGYQIKNGVMVFAQYQSAPDIVPFPVPLEADRCADLAWDWLQSADYPNQPDHDGGNKKGWLIHTDGFDYHYFIAVDPMWIMFGK